MFPTRRHRPQAILALALLAFAGVAPVPQAGARTNAPAIGNGTIRAVPPLVAGDRWCVLGDSITHSGLYHREIELFHATRFPGRPVDVINCGLAGDTATGALKRLQWDCLDAKPTIVSVMLGMNDVGRHLYTGDRITPAIEKSRAERAANYERAMRELTARILATGARVILVTPSIFDDTARIPKTNNPGCGAALADFSRRIRAIAADLSVPTVDFNGPMTAINVEQQARDPAFTIVGADRVHPTAPGHLVMAHAFLKAQQVPGLVSRIEIDAATGRTGRVENCEVTKVAATSERVLFTALERALPFPVDPAAKPALDWVPFVADLNQEILSVKGLRHGSYELRIDGIPVRAFDSEQLAAGVNLALESNTPQMKQALLVRTAFARKWEAADQLRTIAYSEHGAFPDAPRPLDTGRMMSKVDQRLARAGTNNPWIVARLRQYADAKRSEAALRRETATAAAAARELATPRAHEFALFPLR
jgi:lysophospholipase L1-like esterase